MEFKEFLNTVTDMLPDYLFSYDIESIRVQTVTKNNGINLTGLVIMVKDEDIAPNIYMEYYYNMYRQGKGMDDIVSGIAEEYENIRCKMPEYNIGDFDIKSMKNTVYMVLVNYEKNKEKLADCPHIQFLDLAVMFRFVAAADDECISSGIVRNVEQSIWELSTEELYKLAYENTRKQFPMYMMKLSDKLRDMKPDFGFVPETNLYILSNTKNSYGAKYMTDKDALEKFADICESSFYIIPSSVHEVLLLPENTEMTRDQLRDVINEVNQYVLSDLEYLSDKLYYYDRDKRTIEF